MHTRRQNHFPRNTRCQRFRLTIGKQLQPSIASVVAAFCIICPSSVTRRVFTGPPRRISSSLTLEKRATGWLGRKWHFPGISLKMASMTRSTVLRATRSWAAISHILLTFFCSPAAATPVTLVFADKSYAEVLEPWLSLCPVAAGCAARSQSDVSTPFRIHPRNVLVRLTIRACSHTRTHAHACTHRQVVLHDDDNCRVCCCFAPSD